MNQFVFALSESCIKGITDSLKKIYQTSYPVIICVGSDLAVGDSLGPYIGSELTKRHVKNTYIYGTLTNPITAKEIPTVYKTIKNLHPKSKILVIDAAVGSKEDIGLIKVTDRGIKPGLGVNKNLDEIGDASIIGIVAESDNAINNILHTTRFSLIYNISKIIVNGIVEYLN